MHHNLSKALVAFASLLTCSLSAPSRPSGTGGHHGGAPSAKALYFITNDASNAVAAVPIGSNGMLSMGTVTPTGGSGEVSISSADNQPASPDGLLSQSCLTIAGNVCFLSRQNPELHDD